MAKNRKRPNRGSDDEGRESSGEPRAILLIEAARSYAKQGDAVLPLHTPTGDSEYPCSCGERGCKSAGKHPRTKHGLKDATTDLTQIEKWWDLWPNSNVARLTDRLVVLDVDGPIGERCLEEYLAHRQVELPHTLVAITGRGRQLIYRRTDQDVRCRNGVLSEVDIKAVGGYIVASPSLHESGVVYGYEDPAVPIAPCPQVIADLYLEAKVRSSRIDITKSIEYGRRNDTLFRYACSLRSRGATTDEIDTQIRELNLCKCIPPLVDTEVSSVISSACSYKQGQRLTDRDRYVDRDLDISSSTRSKSLSVRVTADIFPLALSRVEKRRESDDIPKSLRRYSSDQLFLALMCLELWVVSRLFGFEDFFLPCRKGAELIGTSNQDKVAEMLRGFILHGFLIITKRGNTKIGHRYKVVDSFVEGDVDGSVS